jgi:hypothetical protein
MESGESRMIFQHTHSWITGFSPHTGQPKTRTSRLRRDGDFALDHQGRIYDDSRPIFEVLNKNGRLKYQLMQTQAVQIARGQAQIARIRLLVIEPFMPAQITLEQANAEGFATTDAFNELWAQMYGWEACGLLTWGLGFELVK